MNNNNINMKANNFKLVIEKALKQIPIIEKQSEEEHSTRQAIIDPLLRCLEYDTTNLEIIIGEYKKEGIIDYVIFINGKIEIIVEAKKVSEKNLEKHTEQLKNYAELTGARIAILTNGVKWLLFMINKNGEMSEYPFKTIDISKLTEEDIKEIVGEYNYKEVSRNINLIIKLIEKEQRIIELEKKEEANKQTTFKISTNKEEEKIKGKINFKELGEKHKCIKQPNVSREKKILFNKTVSAIESKFSDIEYIQNAWFDNLKVKGTDIILGSLGTIYKGIRMYINVEEINDPEDLTSDKDRSGKKIPPKGECKNGYGQYYYTIEDEEDIGYAIFLLKQSYQKNNSY